MDQGPLPFIYIYMLYISKCNSSGAEATPANEEIPSLTSPLLLQTFRLTRYGGQFLFVSRFPLQIKTTVAGFFPVWTRRQSREQLTGTSPRSLPCRHKAAGVAAASCQRKRGSSALYSQTISPATGSQLIRIRPLVNANKLQKLGSHVTRRRPALTN